MNKSEITLAGAFLGLFLWFWSWLTPGKKLTKEETDRYLQDIEKQIPAPRAEMQEFLDRLCAWAEADDGKPVYMLNLMREYSQLQKFPGIPDFAGTPEESNAYYEQRVLPMLFKRGGYPMVGGPAQGKNLMTYEPDLDDWSRVLIVRYPSRRAFLSLMADPDYAAIEPYKVMALKVLLTPVSGQIVTPELRTALGSTLLSGFLAAGWIRASRKR